MYEIGKNGLSQINKLDHLHFELDDSILKTHVDNITPVLLYCRPDPCVQKLLQKISGCES